MTATVMANVTNRRATIFVIAHQVVSYARPLRKVCLKIQHLQFSFKKTSRRSSA